MTWSCVFTLDPHIRFFLGLCSVFKVQCLAILAFVLLPYRVDLYIIPRDLGYVNTFSGTFLRFFRETLGFVEKETCLIIAFIGIKNSSKNLKKSSIFSCFFHKNRRKSVKFFFAAQNFFVNFCLFFSANLRKRFRSICIYTENQSKKTSLQTGHDFQNLLQKAVMYLYIEDKKALCFRIAPE